MLASHNRFHRRNHVQRVLAKGSSVRGKNISLKYRVLDDQPLKVAVVVSKKVSKKAVTRNKIRRRVFAQVRDHKEFIPDGCQLVIGVYSDTVANMPHSELSAEISGLLKKIS